MILKGYRDWKWIGRVFRGVDERVGAESFIGFFFPQVWMHLHGLQTLGWLSDAALKALHWQGGCRRMRSCLAALEQRAD